MKGRFFLRDGNAPFPMTRPTARSVVMDVAPWIIMHLTAHDDQLQGQQQVVPQMNRRASPELTEEGAKEDSRPPSEHGGGASTDGETVQQLLAEANRMLKSLGRDRGPEVSHEDRYATSTTTVGRLEGEVGEDTSYTHHKWPGERLD